MKPNKQPEHENFNLQRFVEAQDLVFEQVVSELRNGRKRTHWMWFIFPQIAGLGQSPTARNFALSSLEEAQAYINHPVLGPRLCECTHLVNLAHADTIDEIFGYPDNLKFHSCVTLFAHATSINNIFHEALQKYFEGQADPLTLEKIEK